MSPTAQSSRWRSKDAKIDKEQKDKRRKFSLSLQKQKKKKRTECNFARAGTVRGKKKLNSKSCLPRSCLVLISPRGSQGGSIEISDPDPGKLQMPMLLIEGFGFVGAQAQKHFCNTPASFPNRKLFLYAKRQEAILRSRQDKS